MKSLSIYLIIILIFENRVTAKDKAIQLFPLSEGEHLNQCITTDYFVAIHGIVKVTGTNLRTIAFKKHSHNSIKYLCFIQFPERCTSNPDRTGFCYCTPTEDPPIYNITLNLTLPKDDNQSLVQGVMLNYGDEKLYSNNITLPAVYNLDLDEVTYELFINEELVNVSYCVYNISDGKLDVHYNRTSSEILNSTFVIIQGEETTQLNNSGCFRLKSINATVNFVMYVKVGNCKKNVFNVSCHFYTDNRKLIDELDNLVVQLVYVTAMASILLIMAAAFIVAALCLRKSCKKTPASEELLQINDKKTLLSENKLNPISLLLIGKLGNGKSATGNTILGKISFKSTSNPDNDTNRISRDSIVFQGRQITVVDGPSLDGNIASSGQKERLNQDLLNAFCKEPNGFDALLFVYRYGARFTYVDYQNVLDLKDILGADLIKDHSIIIFTGGDYFDTQEAGTDSFKTWCENQTGLFQMLYEECKKRVILFDNKTKDKQFTNEQRTKLFECVDKIIKDNEEKKLIMPYLKIRTHRRSSSYL